MHRFLVTGFYSGLSPKAPGTCGSAAAALSVLVASLADINANYFCAISALISTILGFYCIKRLYQNGFYQDEDPKEVVIDEFAGMYLAAISLYPGLLQLALSFVAFRLFDILKPGLVSRAEKLPGAKGIMSDDIVAGIWASVLVNVLLALSQLV